MLVTNIGQYRFEIQRGKVDLSATDIRTTPIIRTMGPGMKILPLAHPTRVRILRLLARKEARMCSHILDELPLAQSAVSEHLRILRAAGLVRANESGSCVGYCIVPPMVRRLKQLLEFL